MARRYNRFEAYTASDADSFPNGSPDAIYVGSKGSTGTIVGVKPNGDLLTLVGVQAGTILPIRLTRINDTTTDAGSFVLLYER